jgi:hypothetical protein
VCTPVLGVGESDATRPCPHSVFDRACFDLGPESVEELSSPVACTAPYTDCQAQGKASMN